MSATGEPLFHHDFPSRSIPKEFKPSTRAQGFGIMDGREYSDTRFMNQENETSNIDLAHERQPRSQSPMKIALSRDRSVVKTLRSNLY
jgi:hypothetical protein